MPVKVPPGASGSTTSMKKRPDFELGQRRHRFLFRGDDLRFGLPPFGSFWLDRPRRLLLFEWRFKKAAMLTIAHGSK
jgi:hypothetical protein